MGLSCPATTLSFRGQQDGIMARRRRPDPSDFLGSLEAKVMKDLWKNGESSVGEVLERLNAGSTRSLAYSTVMSVMARLAEKGILRRERHGRAYRYEPVSDREGFLRAQASQAARELFTQYGDAAVAGLADELRDDPQLRERLDDLLGESEG